MEKYDKSQQRFDRWAKSYDRSLLTFYFNYAHARILEALKPKDGMRILDVGCGTGALLEKINSMINGELKGIDFSPEMITTAKKERPLNIEFLVADVAYLPFDSNYFDAIVNSMSFHHYPDQPKALSEMQRVLKQDGKLYMADHSFSYVPGLVYLMNFILNIFEGPIKINSRNKMRAMFEEQGLSVQSVRDISLIGALYVCQKNPKISLQNTKDE